MAASRRRALLKASPQKLRFCGDPGDSMDSGRPTFGLPASDAALAARPRRAVGGRADPIAQKLCFCGDPKSRHFCGNAVRHRTAGRRDFTGKPCFPVNPFFWTRVDGWSPCVRSQGREISKNPPAALAAGGSCVLFSENQALALTLPIFSFLWRIFMTKRKPIIIAMAMRRQMTAFWIKPAKI